MSFFIFAESPRCGEWNHKFIISEDNHATEETCRTYGKHVREASACDGVIFGKGFCGIRKDVFQVSGETKRKSQEIIVIAKQDCDFFTLSDEEKTKIKKLLRRWQSELENMVTQENTWRDVGEKLLISRPELGKWHEELKEFDKCGLLPSDLKPKSNKKKNMSKLLILTLALGIGGCIACRAIPKWIVDSNSNGDMAKSLTIRQRWLDALQITDITDKSDNHNKVEESILEKLRSAIGGGDLKTQLQNLAVCFDVAKGVSDVGLDDLLQNQNLREKVKKLFSKEPFDFLAGVEATDAGVSNHVKEGLEKIFNPQNKPEENSRHINEIRKLISASIEVQKLSQKMADEAKKDDWVRHAVALSFMKERRDISKQWENVKKLSPNFITDADFQMLKQIYSWLTEGEAELVLGFGIGDFTLLFDAVVKCKKKESAFWKPTSKDDKIYFYRSNNEEIPEKVELYKAIQSFRDVAEEITKSIEKNKTPSPESSEQWSAKNANPIDCYSTSHN